MEDINFSIGFSEPLKSEDASGKHKFLLRLKREFKRRKIKIDNAKPDIYLLIPGALSHKTAFNVLRLDGLIVNKDQPYKDQNNKILKAISKCHALIYQNEFCRTAYERFLGVSGKPFSCILNGANPATFDPREPKNYFLANCKWRPHKRLKEITESFIVFSGEKEGIDLVVTGEPEKKFKHGRIKYVGYQLDEAVKKLIAGAIASVHLSWLDWCPNAMVEAMAGGCPVIYSASGGHPEIAGQCGVPISDAQWDFAACDYYNPPKLSLDEIVSAYHKVISQDTYAANDALLIENVADKYLSFFSSCLNNRAIQN